MRSRVARSLAVGCALAAAYAGCSSADVAGGPGGAEDAGDAARWWVMGRYGAILSFDANDDAASATTQVIDLATAIPGGIQANGEGGLLGFAFHPRFATNHQVYLSYTAHSATSPVDMRTVIARYTSNDGGVTLDPA